MLSFFMSEKASDKRIIKVYCHAGLLAKKSEMR